METVKVRIAVVVDAKGRWNAVGWNGGEVKADADLLETAYAGMDFDGESLPEQEAWITAEIPIPKAPPVLELQGKVDIAERED